MSGELSREAMRRGMLGNDPLPHQSAMADMVLDELFALRASSASDKVVEGLREALQAKADRAYLDYHAECNRTECLGEEAKIKTGRFGVFELNAHRKASEYLGRHRAYADAIAAIARLTPGKEGRP